MNRSVRRHQTTRLWDELHQELREEGSGGNEDNNDDYFRLDDDDLDTGFLAKLFTSAEAMEAATEQRALTASFETQRHDQSARQLMMAEEGGGG
jgi:hypothetical protein